VGSNTFDALVFGYYEGDRQMYAGRTRNGFTPVRGASRGQVGTARQTRIARSPESLAAFTGTHTVA
jgi:hypothetical protein